MTNRTASLQSVASIRPLAAMVTVKTEMQAQRAKDIAMLGNLIDKLNDRLKTAVTVADQVKFMKTLVDARKALTVLRTADRS